MHTEGRCGHPCIVSWVLITNVVVSVRCKWSWACFSKPICGLASEAGLIELNLGVVGDLDAEWRFRVEVAGFVLDSGSLGTTFSSTRYHPLECVDKTMHLLAELNSNWRRLTMHYGILTEETIGAMPFKMCSTQVIRALIVNLNPP